MSDAKRLTAVGVVERLRKSCEVMGNCRVEQIEKGIQCGVRLSADLVEANLIETPEQSRERFERWRLSQDDTAAALARRHADGSYQDVALRLMWTTWEASRTFRSAQES